MSGPARTNRLLRIHGTIVGSDNGDPIADSLRRSADRRGVPVLLPLLDVEDQSAVDYADVRGGFHDRLLSAARRYGVDRVLVAMLERRRDRSWHGQWTLYSDGEIANWSARALDPDQVVARGLDGLARQLASLYAVRRSAAVMELRLRVEDVRELEDYGAVDRFLRDLALTRRVRLQRVTADSLEFLVEVQGGLPDLERALALSPSLYASDTGLRDLFEEPAPDAGETVRGPRVPLLVYRYRP